MTFVKKSFEQMLEEIEFEKWVKYDLLIPEETPDLFVEEEFYDSCFKMIESDYVKSLQHLIRSFGSSITEIFLNAFERGNQKQEYLPVSVKVFKGAKGYVLRIRDSGEGFDYKYTIKKLKNGKRYWNRFGSGFFILNNSDYDISFEGDGSIVNMQILNKNKK